MDKFLLGAATSAHQVEGNNIYSDYWAQEHMKHTRFIEPSLMAVYHYNRFKEDIDLLKQANLNSYRFSIEWARIEPQKGVFNQNEIEHYREVLAYCHQKEITPIVTLHHFSSPKWLIEEGGWENEMVIDYFTNYCEYVVKHLGSLMGYVCTINEANMGLYIAMKIAKMKKLSEGSIQVGLNLSKLDNQAEKDELLEVFKTQTAHTFLSPRSMKSDDIVFASHQKAKERIKAIQPNLKVGLTLSLHDFQSVDENNVHAQEEWGFEFERYIDVIKTDDFFGLQNYTRKLFGPEGELPVPAGHKVTQMKYEYYPQALENVIRKVAQKINIPIIVTENGIATNDDKDRVDFISEALDGVKRCISDGIDVRGYMYWSLMDNFEWQVGYKHTFGLIEVNRETFERTPKPSLYYLASKYFIR